MAGRDGNGVFTVTNPNFVAGTVIDSEKIDQNFAEIATAITQSIASDGQTAITANIPFSNNKITGLGSGTALTDAANIRQVQNGLIWCGTMGGTANAGTLTPSPAITAYAAGQRFFWKSSSNANTDAMTIDISGLGTIAAQKNQAALVAGDHEADTIYMGVLDTTSTIQIMKFSTPATGALANLDTVDTDQIDAEAVTLAKMADLAQGSVIAGGASDRPAALALASGKAAVGDGTGVAAVSVFTKAVRQVFTSSGTYTPTAGMIYCDVEVQAPGGGGGGGDNQGPGSGGGSGGYTRKIFTAATIGSSQTVTIGSIGSGGDNTPSAGGDAGDVSFGSLLVATGGDGGEAGDTTTGSDGGAGGTVSTSGDYDIPGAQGQGGGRTNGYFQGGQGASSQLGNGGGGGGMNTATASAGGAGKGFGAGGGGAGAGQTTKAAGGDGAPGCVIVTEFVAAA